MFSKFASLVMKNSTLHKINQRKLHRFYVTKKTSPEVETDLSEFVKLNESVVSEYITKIVR